MGDSSFFVVLIIVVIIALIAREFWCWYWKINKVVSLLESINRKLDNCSINFENNGIRPEISEEKINNIKNKVDGDVLQEGFAENNHSKLVSELNAIYNLYKDKIYSEQDFISKKNNWIESLKNINFVYNESKFLATLSPLIKENILSSEELETVKYVVSGEYSKEKFKKEQEIRANEEDAAKQKREELINNVKNQTKEMANKTFDKINDILKSKPVEAPENNTVCECGQVINDEFVFCTNCGKKLK